MTSIKQIREAIDSGLDSLQAKAEAAAAHLELSDDEIHQRIADIQYNLKESASALQSKMAETEESATETEKRSNLRSNIYGFNWLLAKPTRAMLSLKRRNRSSMRSRNLTPGSMPPMLRRNVRCRHRSMSS